MDILFDCSSGVSGDMIVGALLDLGANEDKLKSAIKSLKLEKNAIFIKKIKKNGVFCTDFDVFLENNNSDHDLDYLSGKKKVTPKFAEKRNLKDVKNLLENSSLSENAKNIANKIFEIIAESEAKAHGVKKEEVVFHESGAMDSIIDISAIAFCLDELKVENVYVENLCEGHGRVQTRVGFLPVPTPAVKNIAEKFSIKLSQIDFEGELITPTGLGALAAVGKFEKIKNYSVLKTGYGAGKRNYNLPCVLKVNKIERSEK